MSIGSLEEARIIEGYDNETRPPKGWKRIGHGSSRTAFLAPSGIVYKTPHWGSGNWIQTNEVKYARRLAKKTTLWLWDVRIPEITPHRVGKSVINAMEYLPTQLHVGCDSYGGYGYWTGKKCSCRKFGTARPCFGLVTEYLESELNLEDMWEGNLSYYDKHIYVIDLGEYS